jgi:hypothetical protein
VVKKNGGKTNLSSAVETLADDPKKTAAHRHPPLSGAVS